MSPLRTPSSRPNVSSPSVSPNRGRRRPRFPATVVPNPYTLQASSSRPRVKRTTKKGPPAISPINVMLGWIGSVMVISVAISLYAFPLLEASVTRENGGEAVLNEQHLLNNPDILGTATSTTSSSSSSSRWWNAFVHDYWGNSFLTDYEDKSLRKGTEALHRSWRPVSVLSLRFLSVEHGWFFPLHGYVQDVLLHRMINTYLHGTCSLLVGILASQLFPSRRFWVMKLTEYMASIIFFLHPTHVEAVANAANRPHLIALFVSLSVILWIANTSDVVLDRQRHVFARRKRKRFPRGLTLLWILGLLSCETIVFQLPAIIVTAVVVRWKQGRYTLKGVIRKLYPEMRMFCFWTSAYLFARYQLMGRSLWPTLFDHQKVDTPFAHLEGGHRWRNYGYVVSIHIGKAFGVDPIGFAHEYSQGCVDPLETWNEFRSYVVIAVVFSVFTSTLDLFDRKGYEPALLWVLALAWMASTLFPVCGVLPVHTFIADRLILPSTVVPALFIGHWCADALYYAKNWIVRLPIAVVIVWFLVFFWGARVADRITHWTDHFELLQKTHENCPRSVKNLLHLSQVYADKDKGDTHDLNLALSFAQQAAEVDSSYCPLEYQLAHIYAQRRSYIRMEPHLVRARVCPETAGEAESLWNDYWPVVIPYDTNAAERKANYEEWIREEFAKQTG